MTEVVRTIVIDSRFSGPPGLGNGDYVAGVVARAVGSEATVTLRAPIPLDTPLELSGNGAGTAARTAQGVDRTRRAELRLDGSLLAEAGPPEPLDLSPPPMPDRSTALAATGRYPGRVPNPYQPCFVCGCARAPGSGLRVFAGPTPAPGFVAAHWPVHPGLGDEIGAVPDGFLWGALDCPGACAVGTADLRLGRMTARLSGRIRPGERCTVAGWQLESERRKHFTGTAVYGEAGNLVALASAVWIASREDGPAPRPGPAGNERRSRR